MQNSKTELIFPYFFIFIFIFALISQRCLKKWVNFFFRFSWKFFISSSFLPRKFLICKFAFTLVVFICWLLWHVFIHFSRKRCVFWNVLQKRLYPQLFILFLQYHNKITKSYLLFNVHGCYCFKLFYISMNINV